MCIFTTYVESNTCIVQTREETLLRPMRRTSAHGSSAPTSTDAAKGIFGVEH